jgi:TBC1 domain-containing protein 4
MSQGIQHPENFGFICRDVVSENNVCYVFKCQNNSVADEIMTGQSYLFIFFLFYEFRFYY